MPAYYRPGDRHLQADGSVVAHYRPELPAQGAWNAHEQHMAPGWPGPVIVACGNVCCAPPEQETPQWHVNLSYLQDLRRAVSQAQGLSPYARPVGPGTRVYKPLGLHVLVVDDVMTTGATLDELARCLKAQGAARVTNLVVARTPAPA